MHFTLLKSALIPLALFIAAPVAAQEQPNQERSQQSQEQQEQAQQEQAQKQQAAQERQARGAAQKRQQNARKQKASQQGHKSARGPASAEGLCSECQAKADEKSGYSSQAVRRHYLAGFVRGYYSGFSDGVDDYVIVVGKQGDPRGQASADRRQQSDRQSQDLRNRLRQNSRSRMSGQMKSTGESRINQSQGSQRPLLSKQRVSGEVAATKRTKLQNDDQVHLILLVTTDQGQRRIIDAGPDSQARRLSIKKGDQIIAEGRMKRTRDGVPVLMSQRVGKARDPGERERTASQRNQDLRQWQRSNR